MPMVMQPIAHDLTAPRQMLPIMPMVGAETRLPAAKKKQPSRSTKRCRDQACDRDIPPELTQASSATR